jgi:hypothetical protein
LPRVGIHGRKAAERLMLTLKSRHTDGVFAGSLSA